MVLYRSRGSSGQARPSRGATRSTGSAKLKSPKAVPSMTQPLHSLSALHMHSETRHDGSREDGIDVRMDVDQTVQRLEKELDDVVATSLTTEGGVASTGLGNYADDILPGGAENMGSGNAMLLMVCCMCVHVCCMIHIVTWSEYTRLLVLHVKDSSWEPCLGCL